MRPPWLTLAVLCSLAGAAAGQSANSVDAWINLTLSGTNPAVIDASSLDSADLIARLDALYADNPGTYYYLRNAVVQSLTQTYDMNQVSVSECSMGSYIDPADKACKPCRAGTYSMVARSVTPTDCLPCGTGTFSNVTGATSVAVCQSCPVGTFSSVLGANSSSTCQGCGVSMTSPPGATSLADCVCSPGYYNDNGCKLCTPGYYCSQNQITSCPNRAGGVSTSDPGAKDVSDCYCQPGYFGVAGGIVGCEVCHANNYCPGEISPVALVKNVVVQYPCPDSSTSPGGITSTSVDSCTCVSSYRKSPSSNAERFYQVTASQCNCTNDYPCAGGTCESCTQYASCFNVQGTDGKTVTCPQGQIYFLQSNVNSIVVGKEYTWYIAPTGGNGVSVNVFNLNTGTDQGRGLYNVLQMVQCLDTSCLPSTNLALGPPSGLNGNPTPNSFYYTTAPGYKVVKIVFTTQTALGAQVPFRVSYSSLKACGSTTTVDMRLQSMQYLPSGPVTISPSQVDNSWPLVVWEGDSVHFGAYPASAGVPYDLFSGSPTGAAVTDSLSPWQPLAGLYYLVDRTLASRWRAVYVNPLDKRTVNVYYGTGSSFTLSGAYSGVSSPDIVLVVGDVLVMTRVSGAAGVVLLSGYNATSGSFPALTAEGHGVTGQSTSSTAETTLTWDTAGKTPGLYYYASAVNTGSVKPGRVLLYPPAGGAQCLYCNPGEYCYNGAAVTCPPNSWSPAGATTVAQCQCAPGFARSTADLDSYVHGQTVDSGGRHSCVIASDGTLWCWGANEAGQLGLGYVSAEPVTTPTQVPSDKISDVRNVSLGSDFTCVVAGSALQVYCWGSNFYGALGLDDSNSYSHSPGNPAKLAGMDAELTSYNWYQTLMLACGAQTCCAVIDKNSAASPVRAVTCWGRGDRNQLGEGGVTWVNGAATGTAQPARRGNVGTGAGSYKSTGGVSLTFGTGVASLVTVGGDQSCALMTSGDVYCWGFNANGAVGVGSSMTTAYYNPSLVSIGANKAITVNCYDGVCCVVTRDAYEVKCWGKGAGGRLGVGVFDVGTTAASMGAGLQSANLGKYVYAMDVNVGSEQTCALLSNNTVKCWGLVNGVVLGDSPASEMSNFLPSVRLAGSQVALQISGKGGTTCAVMSDYNVVCWGSNEFGQLGGPVLLQPNNITAVALPGGAKALQATGSGGYRITCSVCSLNKYCPGLGFSAQDCPANTVSAVQSATALDCKCQPGYKRPVGSSGSCSLCTGVEYCMGGIATACPLNSATLADGSSTLASCQCAKGYYRGALGCTLCQRGRYKDAVNNNASCTLCPAGTRSTLTGATSLGDCAVCPAGTSSLAGSEVCNPCSSGFAAAEGSGNCTRCAAGFFSDGTLAACSPCLAGTFDNNPFNGEPGQCESCPAGTASMAQNASSSGTCKPCAPGFVSNAGAAACRACDAGQYSLAGVAQCLQCPGNATSAPGSAYGQCYCLPGFNKRMLDATQFACDPCPPGRFSEGNASVCSACPPGTASPVALLTSGAGCGSCPAGQFAPAGSTACRACAGWSASASAGSGSCANCSLGFYAAVGATACTACPQGFYALAPITSSAGCQLCDAGSFCVGGLQALANNLPQRQRCPDGTFSTSTGMQSVTQCTPCPADWYCPTPVLKAQCPDGTTSNQSSTSQLQCLCKKGYTCSYTKVVNAVVTLLMSAQDFQENQVIQDAFKRAVAAAAKTTPDKVTIYRVIQRTSGRRLLALRAESHVILVIHDGDGKGLERDLDFKLERTGIRLGAERAWIEPHRVEVKRAELM